MSHPNAALSQPRDPETISAKDYREGKAKPAKRNKFNARKTVVDGETFDSKAEADRWCNLKLFEHARQIRAVGRQPRFDLKINGHFIGVFTPDFIYLEAGRKVVEDVKGGPLREADSLRMKVFMACWPDIELRIVDSDGKRRPFKLKRYAEKVAA